MTDMSPEAREALELAISEAQMADRHDIDTTPLTRLDGMPEEEAVEAIDEVFRSIHFD
ncbi:hypothetical protein [Spongiactinospora gelatinilytica]|uniref:hypothetical protein n=1 Tax=Spongiactinospora gelatinilytica TaxID=2666298 RepID=UPI0013149B61|nr:hypothetical protein [Spongiactinospora gelatinilytica]